GLWARGPTSALMLGRLVQVVQLGVAARAVGIDVGVLGAFATQCVNLIAAAVGVLVPGGFGTTDGAFTLAANLLSTTVARATSMALLLRCMQFAWVPIGSVLALLGSPARPARW
ncbi:MAG: lysylphosphatidylglycerol synthase domain-containing protein, partial [Polyangiaceae bacterium]